MWESGVVQCKELIGRHEYTFNYERLTELHVSGLQPHALCQQVMVNAPVCAYVRA